MDLMWALVVRTTGSSSRRRCSLAFALPWSLGFDLRAQGLGPRACASNQASCEFSCDLKPKYQSTRTMPLLRHRGLEIPGMLSVQPSTFSLRLQKHIYGCFVCLLVFGSKALRYSEGQLSGHSRESCTKCRVRDADFLLLLLTLHCL